jgi:hypothetical protein
MMSIETINRAESVKRGRHLEYLTIIWNSLEGIVSIGAACLREVSPSSVLVSIL